MLSKHLFGAILIALSFCVFAAAQSPTTETEKDEAAAQLEENALEMLEQAVTEAGALRLPENRALVLVVAGDSFWQHDQKRARQLFREAVDQVIYAVGAAQGAPLTTSSPFGREDLHSLRQMVLTTIARYDAEFALESLAPTRPAEVSLEHQEYLAAKSGAATSRRSFLKAEREVRLEQSLIAQTTSQDPVKAAKLVRENLAKGQTMQVLNLIFKIAAKDSELANALISESFTRMIESDLAKSANDSYFALTLLRTFSQPLRDTPSNRSLSKLRVDDRLMRDLVVKFAERLMSSNYFGDSALFSTTLPLVQKYAREKVAALKQKQAALKKQTPENVRVFDTPASLENPEASSSQIIADAARAEPQMRGILFRTAAMRAISAGEPEKVRAQLQDLPQSKERDDAIALIDARLAQNQIAQGRFEEARRLIERTPAGLEKTRQTVQLAISAAALKTEEGRENALALMEDARQMVREFPEDRDEADGLIAVAAGFAVIDPARAFGVLGPVIAQANDLINASALVAKYYRQEQYFRDGEIIMAANLSSGGSRFLRFGREVRMLAKADFDRTRGLVDQFSRTDVRVFARAMIAQGILKERVGFETNVPAE
jgi:hypothetical protein